VTEQLPIISLRRTEVAEVLYRRELESLYHLCFHRHSRFARSFLKSSFLLALSGRTFFPSRNRPICGLFVLLGTFSGVGPGGQQHYSIAFPAGRDHLPSFKLEL
jgi:hypothetical protein